ncbi:MAG: fibronectin type III domain-containing protein, partial [Methylobacter sp.]
MKNYLTNISLRELFPHFLLVGFALLLFSSNSFAGSANLAWNASTSSNVGGYKVSYGQSSGSYSSTVDVGNTTTYTMPNMQEGTKYYFAVKAYDSTKTIESAYSNEANMTVPVTTTSTTPTTTSTTPTTTSTTPTTTSTSTSSNGLVAAYGFEETSGTTVADASGNGNLGTINGAARVTTGHSGNALQFNGTSNWVTVNDSASLDLSA